MAGRHFDSHPERSGRIFEATVIDPIVLSDAYYAAVKAAWDGHSIKRVGDEELPKIEFDDAYRIAKEFQPTGQSTTSPRKRIANDLRIAVIDEMKKEIDLQHKQDKNVKAVRLYSARESILDKIYGVDLFIEIYDLKTGKAYSVLFDATLNRQKLEANDRHSIVFIPELPDAEEELDAYQAAIDRIAQEAAGHIRSQRASAIS